MERAFFPADILLPKNGIDMGKWSVVACDQFTSEPEYWEKVEELVGGESSTFRMILPEVYLEDEDVDERLETIRNSMKGYLSGEIFEEYKNAMIYVERTDSTGKMRAGIVGCIDLEQYDYHKGSTSLVRATEATVVERIPPRIRVRENAQVELPHIMILIDDKERTVIEPCKEWKADCKLLYDFDLMMGGGHLKGYLLGEEEQAKILSAIDCLAVKEQKKSQQVIADSTNEKPAVLLFSMGDGNHSLASAKEHYERLKAENPESDFSHHPARYALAEIVNLHSPALEFEAIHRIVTQVNADDLMEQMKQALGLVEEGEGQTFYVVRNGEKEKAVITKPTSKLTVGSLQNFLDTYQKENDVKMDYIHGDKTLEALTMQENSIGFILPDMAKEELFPTVIYDGALPRKTFSMGHAEDKRYYTECRKIR